MNPSTMFVMSLLFSSQTDDALEKRSHDPGAVVFVPDAEAGEGAPPAHNLGKLVLVTDVEQGDGFRTVVDLLIERKEPAATIEVPAGDFAAAEERLREELPEFVMIVSRPERIDVNAHFAFLEAVTRLDADPFVDVAFGYVTGATVEEALAFCERFLKYGKRKNSLPRALVDFGPSSNGETSFSGPSSHGFAKGWKVTRAYHGSVADLMEKRSLLEGVGILHAGGHGMPDGVVDGLSGEDVRREQLNWEPALYFSGPCYCGVTRHWYGWEQGAIRQQDVAAERSFALAALSRGVTALFAGLDPDRGETCSQEIEHLLVHGDALGHASKETYDGTTVALRLPEYRLFRYEPGKGKPQKQLAHTMIGGGASRALFGDPTWTPFRSAGDPAFEIRQRDKRAALELTWKSEHGPTKYWSCVDVYRCAGGWTHRIAFRIEIPDDTARALQNFRIERLEAKSGPLQARFPTAMVERWGGRAYLHVYLVFPPEGQENTFFVERDFDVKLTLAK